MRGRVYLIAGILSIVGILMGSPYVGASPLPPKVDFDIQPRSIGFGQSVMIKWQVKGASKVFVTPIGLVDGAGKRRIKPGQTTTYILVAENSVGTVTKSVTVAVEGSKSNDEFPEVNAFRYPISFKIQTSSLPELLEHIHHVLQDVLKHTVRLTSQPSGTLTFVTNRRSRSELVKPSEKRIGRRRIAFMVEVAERKSKKVQLTYTIKAVIEYRRRIERVWRQEENIDLYETQTRLLSESISSKP